MAKIITLAVTTILFKLALCVSGFNQGTAISWVLPQTKTTLTIYFTHKYVALHRQRHQIQEHFQRASGVLKNYHNNIFTWESIMRRKLDTNLPCMSAEVEKLTGFLSRLTSTKLKQRLTRNQHVFLVSIKPKKRDLCIMVITHLYN